VILLLAKANVITDIKSIKIITVIIQKYHNLDFTTTKGESGQNFFYSLAKAQTNDCIIIY
jgi:hypothetical protein